MKDIKTIGVYHDYDQVKSAIGKIRPDINVVLLINRLYKLESDPALRNDNVDISNTLIVVCQEHLLGNIKKYVTRVQRTNSGSCYQFGIPVITTVPVLHDVKVYNPLDITEVSHYTGIINCSTNEILSWPLSNELIHRAMLLKDIS